MGESDSSILSVILIVVLAIIFICIMKDRKDNFTTGYGVTSGLAFNNRMSYCQPGNEEDGGAFGGGCFLPHRVIV
jgi:hypothetical protein